jgi:hypothetical protein
MLVTEAQAHERWCPWASTPVHFAGATDGGQQLITGASVNRILHPRSGMPAPAEACHCIASRCMAWRWMDSKRGDGRRGLCGLVSHSAPIIEE